ncbi:hypothetical protein TNCV_202581 [Trichonephila clavipes]|nr:hypothetical protein TNCV_202581 [Trichonephila clavipes]
MFKVMIHYRESKILSDIDASEKAGKASKTMNALDVHRLSAPQKTLKSFLRWCVKEQASSNEMVKMKTTVSLHPSYSPDFAP